VNRRERIEIQKKIHVMTPINYNVCVYMIMCMLYFTYGVYFQLLFLIFIKPHCDLLGL